MPLLQTVTHCRIPCIRSLIQSLFTVAASTYAYPVHFLHNPQAFFNTWSGQHDIVNWKVAHEFVLLKWPTRPYRPSYELPLPLPLPRLLIGRVLGWPQGTNWLQVFCAVASVEILPVGQTWRYIFALAAVGFNLKVIWATQFWHIMPIGIISQSPGCGAQGVVQPNLPGRRHGSKSSSTRSSVLHKFQHPRRRRRLLLLPSFKWFTLFGLKVYQLGKCIYLIHTQTGASLTPRLTDRQRRHGKAR